MAKIFLQFKVRCSIYKYSFGSFSTAVDFMSTLLLEQQISCLFYNMVRTGPNSVNSCFTKQRIITIYKNFEVENIFPV